ncbi:MAG: ion transporter [Proteobacteria bacterium]|nr:ion transporter [Pseudomonadota bacterium]
MAENTPGTKAWQAKIFKIIYHADTPAGKWFDIVLIVFIILSVLTVILDSVNELNFNYGKLLKYAEWFFTIIFTIEYILRLISIKKPMSYVFSFFGIVDILSILPSYLAYFFVGAQQLLVIRVLRILRVFRVLKLVQYTHQAQLLTNSIKNSRHKIVVFFFFIFTVLIIFGSVMYLIEGSENGFTSIPHGIYWAVVTLTTVGYGDIAPHTVLGRMVASLIMLTGYSVIAVPTGIFTAELSKEVKRTRDLARLCKTCNLRGHTQRAVFCRRCGETLDV